MIYDYSFLIQQMAESPLSFKEISNAAKLAPPELEKRLNNEVVFNYSEIQRISKALNFTDGTSVEKAFSTLVRTGSAAATDIKQKFLLISDAQQKEIIGLINRYYKEMIIGE